MKYILALVILFSAVTSVVIFDLKTNSDLRNWQIINDGVMGGRSVGTFEINQEGYGVFKGSISLENNGGFSSVRYQFPKTEVKGLSKAVIRLKGDGKDYQFRVKVNARDYYSFITTFSTSGQWQVVEIDLKSLYPSFRGQKLDFPNFSGDHIEEVTFLIANKKKEDFVLILDRLELK